ncbi:unnamed protein product [Ectocarpus sp. 6 AP-2014]
MQKSSFRVRSEREEIQASRSRSCPPEATSRRKRKITSGSGRSSSSRGHGLRICLGRRLG